MRIRAVTAWLVVVNVMRLLAPGVDRKPSLPQAPQIEGSSQHHELGPDVGQATQQEPPCPQLLFIMPKTGSIRPFRLAYHRLATSVVLIFGTDYLSWAGTAHGSRGAIEAERSRTIAVYSTDSPKGKLPSFREDIAVRRGVIDEAVLKVGKSARALSRIAESLTVRDSGPCWLVMLAIAADGTPEKLDTLP